MVLLRLYDKAIETIGSQITTTLKLASSSINVTKVLLANANTGFTTTENDVDGNDTSELTPQSENG